MMDYAGRVAQADTFPKLLRLNAREHGGEIALREKDLGLWRVFTWNDYQRRVHDFALGMIELGLGRGDVIGIIGDNRPDWVAAEIATHAIGAMSLCTTSGTTANPKLAMLAAGRVLKHCATYLAFDPKGPNDEYVSVLPLPWIMEQIYALGKGLLCRMKVNFVEEPETMMHDFREIAPTFVLVAPRLWESIAADVRAGVMDSSPLKQRLFDIGMKAGLSALAQDKRSMFADQLLFRALRDRLGFTRLRSAATGGAALGPDTFKFFEAMGVPLRTLYGQTELLGAYTLHPFGAVDPDTTGVAMPENIEIRIDHPDIHA